METIDGGGCYEHETQKCCNQGQNPGFRLCMTQSSCSKQDYKDLLSAY